MTLSTGSLHVAVCARRFSSNRGGAERYARRAVEYLAGIGHSVIAVGQDWEDRRPDNVQFALVARPRWSVASKTPLFADATAQVLQFAAPRAVSYAITRLPNADVARVTDRVYAHWLHVTSRFPIANQIRAWHPRHRALLQLERRYFQSPRTRYFIVQSQLEKQLIRQYYGVASERLRVVYNGVDSNYFYPATQDRRRVLRAEYGYPDDAPVLLFAASQQHHHKGLAVVFRAIQRLSDAPQLIVVGRTDLLRWQRHARRCGLADRIRFVPAQRDLRSLYAIADLLVVPPLYEPSPNVHLEALACGTPVLTSDLCATAELIQHRPGAGYVTKSGDADSVRQAIEHFLVQPSAERARMSWAARQLATSLPWQQHFEQVLTSLTAVKRGVDRQVPRPRPQARAA